jgi:WD40 repeat protein
VLFPDGKRLYATGGTKDPELTARELRTGRELWTVGLKFGAAVRAISADGRRLAATNSKGLKVFDASDGRVVLESKIETSTTPDLWAVELSPDGTRVALSDYREVTILDVASGKVQHRLPHRARLVAFSPDGKSVLTVGGWVQRWDVQTGKPAYRVPILNKPVGASILRWSVDGKRLLTVWPSRGTDSGDSTSDLLAVWDVESGAMVWRQMSEVPLDDVVLDRDGGAVRASVDNHLRTWRFGARPSEEAVKLAAPREDDSRQYHSFLPDGRLAVQTHTPTHARVDLYGPGGRHDKGPELRWREGDSAPWPISVGTTIVHFDGQRVDLTKNRALPPLQRAESDTHDILPIPGACLLGRVGPNRPLWESLTGRVICARPDLNRNWDLPELSDDCRLLAFRYAGRVGVRDLATDDRVDWLPVPEATALAFDPDARLLATAQTDGTVLIWEIRRARAEWIEAHATNYWADLGADDAAQAWMAIWRLLDHPDRATALLRGRLRPLPAYKDNAEVIARLDHAKFAVREEAARALAKRGEMIEGDLQEALKKAASAELRTRLEQLLAKLDPTVPPAGEVLRGLRCVWLLERIGTSDAKRLLSEVATGATGSRVTIEAKEALERLGK